MRTAATAALVLAGAERARALRRLRAQWREVTRRDFSPPSERDEAAAALLALAEDRRTAPTVPAGEVWDGDASGQQRAGSGAVGSREGRT